MKKLIKMYNEKYGDALGVIDDDFNKEQMYRIYYFIKNNCDDKDIQNRIKMINLDKPKTLEQQLTKLESENTKVNSSSDEFKEFTFDGELSTTTVKYVNINTLTAKTRYKLSTDDHTTRRVTIYYNIPNSIDKINLINILPSPQQYEFYCNALGKTSANIFVRSYIYSSVSYRITLGNTLDACSVEPKVCVLSSSNTLEFTPTEEYHPTSKKYVDEKFLTGEIETIMTIPKDELDKCNNGTNGTVSTQSFSKFDLDDYIYYAHYGDKVVKMTYDARYNQLDIGELDENKGVNIGLLFQLNDNRIIPFNSGLAEVQSYVFTNDIIITGNKLLKKYVDDNTPIRSFPVNDTTRTGAVVDVNNITVSGRYVLPKRTDGKQWTNLMMRAMINDGSGKGKSLLLSGYQNYVFYVNIENKKIYCDNLRIVYSIGTTADTTDIRTEPYYLTTTNTKEYTPTTDYNPATKKYVDDNKICSINSETVLATVPASNVKLNNEITINNVSFNKDRKYYIEFLGNKKLCNLSISEATELTCFIDDYGLQGIGF